MKSLYGSLMEQGYKFPEIEEMNIFRYMDIFVTNHKLKIHYMDDPD